MATESIMKPGTPEAKAPLKKSTMIGIGVLVFALMILGAAMQQRKSLQAPPPPVDTKVPLVGTASAIDSEVSLAARDLPELPPSTPERSNNSVALDKNLPAKDEKAEAREQLIVNGMMSKTVITDSSTESSGGPEGALGQDGTQAQLAQSRALAALAAQAEAGVVGEGENRRPGPATSEGLQEAALRLMMRSDAPAPGGDAGWLQQIESMKPTPALKPLAVKDRLVLAQGMIIPAALTRSINSDLPGEITARTTVDVYDTFKGFDLLIPAGSMLYGTYNSGVVVGQERLMFVFTRLVMPNRMSFDLPAAKGMDLAGASGSTGEVNNHFFKRFGSAFLVSLLAMGVERGEPAPGFGSPGGARTAAGQALVDVSRSILERNKTIAPTVSIPAGTRINVQVNRDMVFPSAYRVGKEL